MRSDKKDLTALSEKEYKKVLEIVSSNNIEYVQVDNLHNVYIVSPEIMQKIEKMKKSFARALKRQGLSAPRKDAYYYVAKLINPKDIAIAYHFTTIKKYIYVKDKKSIKANLPQKWEIWVNKQKLLVKEAMKETKDVDFQNKIKQELNEKLAKARAEYDFLSKHLDDDNLKALWTTYKIAKEYPAINYKMEKKSYKNAYLRQYVPNILQFEDKVRVLRLDNEVEDFINSATNAFDFFYYKIED